MKKNFISLIHHKFYNQGIINIKILIVVFAIVLMFQYALGAGVSLYNGGGGENTTDWSNIDWDSPAVQGIIQDVQDGLVSVDTAVNAMNEIANKPDLAQKNVTADAKNDTLAFDGTDIKVSNKKVSNVSESTSNNEVVVNGETFVYDSQTKEWKLKNQTIADAIKALSGETSAINTINLDDGTTVLRMIGPDGNTIIEVRKPGDGFYYHYDTNGNLLNQTFEVQQEGDYAGLLQGGPLLSLLDKNNGSLTISLNGKFSDWSALNPKPGDSTSMIAIDKNNGIIAIKRTDGSVEYYYYGNKLKGVTDLTITEAKDKGSGFNNGIWISVTDATGLGIKQGLVTANLFITINERNIQEKTTKEKPELNYSCDTSTWSCYPSINGPYISLSDCEDNCKPSISKYSCNDIIGQCYPNINGLYSSLNTCQNNCKVTTIKYSCNTITGTCYQDTNGTYSSLTTCQSKCTILQITPPCSIFQFTINGKTNQDQNPLLVFVNTSLKGYFSVNDSCKTCTVTSNDTWGNPPKIYPISSSQSSYTETFKIPTKGTYSFTLECVGSDPQDIATDTISLQNVKAINLPIWREIIPNLGGFLKGLIRR